MTKRLEVPPLNIFIEDRKRKCFEFLNLNGWESNFDNLNHNNDFITFSKPKSYGIDISRLGNEMVFIDDTGDFYHAEINLYTLIGVLVYHRMLPVCFKQN